MVVDIGDMLDIVIWYVSVTLIVGYRHPFMIYHYYYNNYCYY